MRAYEDTDFEEVSTWVKARGNVTLNPMSIPKVGLIKDGVACGFVHFTGTNTFLLEAFATNPAASLYARGKAILDIAVHLIELAREQGANRCVVLTREECLTDRLKMHGFSIEDIKMGISYFL